MAEPQPNPDPVLHDDPQRDIRQRAIRRLVAAVLLIAAAVAGLLYLSQMTGEKRLPAEPVAKPVPPVVEKPVPNELPQTPPAEQPAQETPPTPPAPESATPPVQETPPPPPPQVTPTPEPAKTAKPEARQPSAAQTRAPQEKPARAATTPAVTPAEPAKPVKAAPSPAPVKPAPATTTARPAAVAQPAPAPAPAVKAVAEGAPKGFVVQLGVFSDYANAKQLQERLAKNGIKSYTETRLNVGPFQSKEEADKAQAKLRALGISAVVTVNH